ncbi:MAG: Endo,4-beta-xylanase, partial [Chloroflexota bacterium]|nr:Endo,4-beta-xylanase [Chloroflexota bacterium]
FLGLIALFILVELPAAALPAQLGISAGAFVRAQLWIQEFGFGKADLRIGRVVAVAVVLPFMFFVLTRQWRAVSRPLAWLLAPLGQNSLYAFTAHVVLVAIVALALTPFGLAASSPWWLNALLQVAAVLLIWGMIRRHVLEPTAKTQSLWRASPLAVALLAVVILPWLPTPRTSASPLLVGDDVLARARAYGTPVAALASEAILARARAYGTPIVKLARSPVTPTPITARASSAEIGQPAFIQAVALARSTATPAAAQFARTPQPPATASPPPASPTPTAEVAPLTSFFQRISASLLPAAPGGKLAESAVSAPAPPAQPLAAVAAVAPAEPLPPLPGENEYLLTEYIGPLTGSIYARSFHSDLLNTDMPYWIYLPPGYGQTTRRYPTLYMLHGGGGTLDEWAALGLFEAADAQIQAGALQPLIIVLPQGDKSYWTNGINNTPRYGDYMAYEVVGQIDAAFGTIRDRSARAIGGLSMGAWGALYQGFTHPDIFGVVGAHSPSLYPDDNALKFLGVGEEFASKDPVALARTAAGLEALQIWVDVSANDPWVEATMGLHNMLAQRGIGHEWHLNPGYHASEYWARHAPEYLQFYGRALAGQS